jgi:EAL domain-containing protein (putative c-di-GMP-specific phosphodiesterase class I)
VVPAEFLPTAERYQLLPQLDRWVMTEALKLLGAYAPQFVAQGVRWALNVSSASLADDGYTDFLFKELDAHRLPGGWLAIDIAETAASADLDATRRFVERVTPRGINVALDDFGNGGSALAHLKQLSVRRLKIDGVLVRDVVTDATSDGLVRAVVQIGRQLGLETSGESIADVAIARHLAALGVDYGQGTYFGEARPLLEWLNATKNPEQRRSA